MKPIEVVTTASALVLVLLLATAGPGQEIKLSECPAAVRKTIEAEAHGGRVEVVQKEKEEGGPTLFWADAVIGGKTYAIGVLEDGTLTEMNLALDDAEVPFERCPAAVQATFRHEAFGQAIKAVGKDMKYGAVIYEAAVAHRGKTYEIVVAEDGTLVEKTLVIEDDAIDLAKCPKAVQATFRAHARGGTVRDVVRYTGILHPIYEAEVESAGKVYLVEIADNGVLISKSLEAGEE